MISIAFAKGRLCLCHSTMLQRYQNLVLAIWVPFMQEVKALSSLHICTGSSEPSALDNTRSTTTPCAGANSDLSDMHICGQRVRWRVIFAQSERLQQYLNLMCWLT